MTLPADPNGREPKGDHNRRLALGIDLDELAVEAGITSNQLKKYEMAADDGFDLDVSQRVRAALERLEADPSSKQRLLDLARRHGAPVAGFSLPGHLPASR